MNTIVKVTRDRIACDLSALQPFQFNALVIPNQRITGNDRGNCSVVSMYIQSSIKALKPVARNQQQRRLRIAVPNVPTFNSLMSVKILTYPGGQEKAMSEGSLAFL